MFTGALPRGLGLGQAPASTPQSAAPVVKAERHRMLPEVLNQAGYDTRAGEHQPLGLVAERLRHRLRALRGGRRLRGRWRSRAARRARAKWTLECDVGVRADDGASESRELVSEWIVGEPLPALLLVREPRRVPLPVSPAPPVPRGGPLSERLRAAEDARPPPQPRRDLASLHGANSDVPDEALERMRRLYAACVRYSDAWGWRRPYPSSKAPACSTTHW